MSASFLQEPAVLFLIMLATIFLAPLIADFIYIPKIVGLIVGGLIVGPHGLNILPLNDIVKLFATIGLIYLMFDIGLEVNLDQFIAYRKRIILFFFLTFFIPQIFSILIGWYFNLNLNSSILLGAIFGSYTLVAYPIITRLGILKNEAIAITVSAVVLTDIAALLILIVTLNIHEGNFSFFNLSKLCISITVYSIILLLALPPLIKLFFRYYTNKQIGFLFLLFILFISAVSAHWIGMHAIIGAFLCGLAINRGLSRESGVIKQILFTGESLFVPIFLMSIGMELNPTALLFSTKILIFGFALTAGVYISKLVAALITSYLFHYKSAQMWTIWGLSQAQAAATLAIILIGMQANLFPNYVLNGTIIMVLFTLISSPLLVEYFGVYIKPIDKESKVRPVFKRILAPIDRNDFPLLLIELASMLTHYGTGKLLLLNVGEKDADIKERREKLRAGPLKNPDIEIELINEIEKSVSRCVLKEVIENEASLIMMNWVKNDHRRGRIFSADVDNVVWESTVPVAITLLKTPV